MVPVRLIDRSAFEILGRKTWISGQDNAQFARFWQQCHADGLIQDFHITRPEALLGVSLVAEDPSNRAFFYVIAIPAPPASLPVPLPADVEIYQIPATRWAIFECRGSMPEALVAAEMYAFEEWLPQSGYRHAMAPEMEVYPTAGDSVECEFWLPVIA